LLARDRDEASELPARRRSTLAFFDHAQGDLNRALGGRIARAIVAKAAGLFELRAPPRSVP
jgi:hypothetical protein